MLKNNSYTSILLKDKGFWATLCTIYEVLSNENARKIVSELLDNGETQSTVLLIKTGLSESQFHPIRKKLVQYCIIDKNVHSDRSVSYSISSFAKNILHLSKPLLEKIEKEMKENVMLVKK